MVLAIGFLLSPWTGSLVINFPNRACGAESRIAIAEVRASSPRHGVYAGHQGGPPESTGGSPERQPGGPAGRRDQGGSPGDGNTVGNTVKEPVSGAGNTVGNAVNTVGNTINTVGNTVKEPVSGAGDVLKGLGG